MLQAFIGRSESNAFWLVGPAEGPSQRFMPLRVANQFAVTAFISRFDAVQVRSGAWATVADVDGGSTCFLEYMVEERDLFKLGEHPATLSSASQIHLVRVPLPDGKTLRSRHLLRPSLFLRGEDVLLLGAGQRYDAFSGDAFAWWGDPKSISENGMDAAFIGMGGDPRIARTEGVCWVSVRLLKAHNGLYDAVPFRVYSSRDLQQWEIVEGPQEASHLASYDMVESSGKLWVGGVVIENGQRKTAMWSFDIRSKTWQRHAGTVDLAEDEAQSFYLLPVVQGVEATWVAGDGLLKRQR